MGYYFSVSTMQQVFPKVLILSRGVWDDTKGTSSTLTNLFQDFDSNKLAHVYIESTMPNTQCCHRFFQISEFSLVQKLYKWRTKTGFVIDDQGNNTDLVDEQIAKKENKTMNYVRGHRSIWFSFAREILWFFNGWKSKELKQFLLDFDPDVIWMDGSPLPLMNRLYDYVLTVAKKPAVIFMQDDVYTYESCDSKWSSRLYKWLLRKKVKKVVRQCDDMFVASPKMKKEYDAIFGFNSTFIAKSVDLDTVSKQNLDIHDPIRLVYLGQVIYGRIYSLIAIAEALEKINASGVKIQLSIYTNNPISEEDKKKLLIKDAVFLMPPVPYSEVPRIMSENDVVVFVESFDPRYCNVARLSFSTKICDYLASNKCILAIGPSNIAPIEYFVEEDAAVVATSIGEIEHAMKKLSDKSVIEQYINKARMCLVKHHNREDMDRKIYNKLSNLAALKKQ